ncbi:MAG TPA: type II toxin-antitoxin system RelE/ParE family toxin [Burkholderiales bacterium]|nr:type II toxin-antitoxin system RelE/ParE family toxin [Burkholderiales bacterium]
MASKPVRFSPRAERDLEDIADYIARDNPPRALSFVRELRERCDKLGSSPHAPRHFPQLGPDAHILPYGNYVILYRDLTREVSIARILHGARDIVALIAPDD